MDGRLFNPAPLGTHVCVQMTSGLVQSFDFTGEHYYLDDRRGGTALLNSIAQVRVAVSYSV